MARKIGPGGTQFERLAKCTCAILTIAGFIVPDPTYAALAGSSQLTPGYSARDILQQSPASPSGNYWIDPNLGSTADASEVFADMVTAGGGWTLAHDANNTRPDLDFNPGAINILAIQQVAQVLLVGNGLTAYFSGNWNQVLPSSGWTSIVGTPTSLFSQPFSVALNGDYSVFVRETTTITYPTPQPARVPLPGTVVLLAIGGLAAAVARRRLF